jgi:hypothetical protein
VVYVGAGQTDMIKDCDENTQLSELLSPVLAELPWDQEGEYRL